MTPEQLARARKRLGLSLEQMALMLGYEGEQATVRRTVPRLASAPGLCSFCFCPTGESHQSFLAFEQSLATTTNVVAIVYQGHTLIVQCMTFQTGEVSL